jgi:hypothetical protein
MPVSFVSALFLHPGGNFRSIDKYKTHFHQLASSGVRLYLFLDPALKEYGDELQREFSNVRVLEYLTPDTSFLGGRDEASVKLPARRHPVKDTVHYMGIQLMKLQLVAKAAETLGAGEAPFLSWIDFGIFHMFKKDPAACTAALQQIAGSAWPAGKIISPGCWDVGEYALWDNICWRFCGSFLLGPNHLWRVAANIQQSLVACGLPRLTWEVNYWAMMEYMFHVYKADHDESILTAAMTLRSS